MTYPILSSQHQTADIQQLKQIYPNKKSHLAQKLTSIFSFTFCLGVASTTLLSMSVGNVIAQMPSITNPIAQKSESQVNVLYVNSSVADNAMGNGSEGAPLKTITQALQVATPNTVIMLAPGTYSTETGEVFPLQLKPGVSIQGDTRNQGQSVTIQGGGVYLSRSFGGQNVTIIGANQAGLTGVTVTNPQARGYGLWIESSNPVITENTFSGSTQDGISVTGNSAPMISKNYFYRNGANGITIGGNSQPEVRENMFVQTGFGINITQNAAPVVVSNQIQQNRSGIIVQGKARPILRNNLIQGSQEDGLVAIAQAIPNLGTMAAPGGNEFRNNARHDINASAAQEMMPAAGNSLNQNKIIGKVDFNAQIAPVAQNSQPPTTNGEISVSAASQPNQSQMNYFRIDRDSVEFVAPQSPATMTQNPSLPPSTDPPFGESVLLPNPHGNLPIGTAALPPTQPTSPLPTARVQPRGVRYRVVVTVASDKERDMVRTLAPGAFPTVWQGRRVMQAGVFSDRQNADEMLKILNGNGLRTIVEPLN